jgi:peptidoglycan hydrolase-like protein with peptidoglycan-binding domain
MVADGIVGPKTWSALDRIADEDRSSSRTL